MKFFKFIFWTGALAGLFYLANTVPFNGKTAVEHARAYWDSGVIQDQLSSAGKEFNDKLEKGAEKGIKQGHKKVEEIEEYTEEEQKVITDAIGEYLN